MGLRICIRLGLDEDRVGATSGTATNFFRDVFEANGLRKRGTATYENPDDTLTVANVAAVFQALELLSDLPKSLHGRVNPLPPNLGLDHLWTYVAPWPQFEPTRLVQ